MYLCYFIFSISSQNFQFSISCLNLFEKGEKVNILEKEFIKFIESHSSHMRRGLNKKMGELLFHFDITLDIGRNKNYYLNKYAECES